MQFIPPTSLSFHSCPVVIDSADKTSSVPEEKIVEYFTSSTGLVQSTVDDVMETAQNVSQIQWPLTYVWAKKKWL